MAISKINLLAFSALFSAGALLLPSQGFAHVISEEDHHAFEHKYASMCLAAEKKKMVGDYREADLSQFCECLAKEESKRITKEEVRKFVREDKLPMSLIMKEGLAEIACNKR